MLFDLNPSFIFRKYNIIQLSLLTLGPAVGRIHVPVRVHLRLHLRVHGHIHWHAPWVYMLVWGVGRVLDFFGWSGLISPCGFLLWGSLNRWLGNVWFAIVVVLFVCYTAIQLISWEFRLRDPLDGILSLFLLVPNDLVLGAHPPQHYLNPFRVSYFLPYQFAIFLLFSLLGLFRLHFYLGCPLTLFALMDERLWFLWVLLRWLFVLDELLPLFLYLFGLQLLWTFISILTALHKELYLLGG